MIQRIDSNKVNSQYFSKNNTRMLSSKNVSFGQGSVQISDTVARILVDGYRPLSTVRHSMNKLLSLYGEFRNRNEINRLYSGTINLDEKSPEYMHVFSMLCRKVAENQEVEINIENGALKDIAKSDEACIFVINHDNAHRDPQLLGLFNHLLAQEYISAGKAANCPRSKVILMQSILDEKGAKTRALLEKFGYVGVNADIFAQDNTNLRTVSSLIRDFSSNNINIFIFPEGKLSMFNDFDIEHRFQTGVGKMVLGASKLKKKVKVIPLGFAYDKNAGAIHIGNPIYFTHSGKKVLVTEGNIDSQFASENVVDFYKRSNPDQDGFHVITQSRIPVVDKSLSDYIAGLLCENVRICREESKKSLS